MMFRLQGLLLLRFFGRSDLASEAKQIPLVLSSTYRFTKEDEFIYIYIYI